MIGNSEKYMSKGKGFYEKYIKRAADILCAIAAIVVFSWLYIIIAIIVKIRLGTPVIFKQPRPGMKNPQTGNEKIFTMYKFRTMTEDKDRDGNLLPDNQRLTRFGKLLRDTSMDELPEAFNILKGDMSVIGPRPQLVRDMVFMTREQRLRHTVRPGLSGLAQVSGRNAISWESKLKKDLEYINHITFFGDIRIIIKTIQKVFLKQKEEGLHDVSEVDLVEDYGDYLLSNRKVNIEVYKEKMKEAEEILKTRSVQ